MDELERSSPKSKARGDRQDGVHRTDVPRVDAAAIHHRARQLHGRAAKADPHERAARLRTERPRT